ncbi:MAG TPA: biosynthetic peptidoglycan transglycosylase, partial [Cyclobacteriaceae bacterium]|nr:biosynthetic peptidoglycan transglycosylase [Cyclobacteriaceae bacterium]
KYSFISKLEKTNFRIESLGKPNLKYLSEPFVHKVFENDRFIKDIVLESIDKNFVSINLVPNHLIRAVLYGEDPNFYKHKGIDEIYVGLAIIANYTNRKFTRGASTITMQLVRNLFLTKEKSLYRKVEEIILAWHLEEIYKISKDRQLEIYLNIIEFAPGLYGIANASQFYFDKRISELTVLESLVLTYIIPRPKYFLEAVELKSTKLQRNLKKHVSFYSNIMFKKGVISELELKNLGNEIRFSQNINSSIFL